jgi:hypothetical protein
MSTSTRSRAKEMELVPLSPEQIRELPKPKKGFEAYWGPLLALYKGNEAALSIDGLDIDSVEEAMSDYETLAAAEAEAVQKLALIRATRLLKGSIVWSAELAIYVRAQGARTSTVIQRAISGFALFMKQRARAKTATPTTAA